MTASVATTYTIYHADGSLTLGTVWDWPENPSLEQLKAVIEPLVDGPMEHVRVLDPAAAQQDVVGEDDYRDMFVDEQGHVRASGAKPKNVQATAIYRANWLRAFGMAGRSGASQEALPWIAGDAIVFDRRIWR